MDSSTSSLGEPHIVRSGTGGNSYLRLSTTRRLLSFTNGATGV